jgi:hypothetical protein
MRDGYVARWRGQEYEVSPDGADFRLYVSAPAEGFDQVRAGRYRRVVPAAEVADLAYVRTVCTWRGAPFVVLGEHDSWLRVEYTGGKSPVAQAMGLEEFDFGVYQGWAPRGEVSEVREYRV